MRDESTCDSFEVCNDAPGRLPEYMPIDTPPIVSWSVINDAYNEIISWRKNTFLVPYGKTGRDFIDQLTKHINDWNNGTRRKAKEHQQCLEKRLERWKNGEIECLVREGRAIQRRLQNSKRNDAPNKAKVFAKLVLEGQVNSALRFLSEDGGRGVLPLTDDVMTQLNEKHPTAKEAKLGSLFFGPVEDVPEIIYQEIDGEMIKEAALRTKGSGGGLLVLMRMDLREFWLLNRSRNPAEIFVMPSPH